MQVPRPPTVLFWYDAMGKSGMKTRSPEGVLVVGSSGEEYSTPYEAESASYRYTAVQHHVFFYNKHSTILKLSSLFYFCIQHIV